VIKSFLKEVCSEDIPSVVSLLLQMQEDVGELSLDAGIVADNIAAAIKENVTYFLFLDEKDDVFGTCHLQPVHNYWSSGKRYYLGGFYIAPSHRGAGRFRAINNLLKEWVSAHKGIQIYSHIHEDNHKSLAAFDSVDIKPVEYLLCVHHWGD